MENSGKLTVLSKMLEYLHTNTREKIVVVSNYTQVCKGLVIVSAITKTLNTLAKRYLVIVISAKKVVFFLV